MNSLHESVNRYYSEVLKTSADLKTSACCTAGAMPAHVRRMLSDIHPEIKDRFYGCGSPLPEALDGCTVLDLGCGTGRDCYLLSRLVGENGRVIGVDMTSAQIDVARRYIDWHTARYGYARSNVTFVEGRIEDLGALGIEDASVDSVVSNCVINLSADKERVFAEALRVLKPGGELHFSDVFADRRVPTALLHDPVLVGECLAGALYFEDFRRLMAKLGCLDVRVVARTPVSLDDADVARKIGMVRFDSVTLRVFKLALEDRCEDYGQVATYLGTLPDHPHAFILDNHHRFETGRPVRVCGNTADMLTLTRYATHFRIDGNKQTHFGAFECAPNESVSGQCC